MWAASESTSLARRAWFSLPAGAERNGKRLGEWPNHMAEESAQVCRDTPAWPGGCTRRCTGPVGLTRVVEEMHFGVMNMLRIGWLGLWMVSASAQAQGHAHNTGAMENGTSNPRAAARWAGSENDEAMAWFLERAGGGDILCCGPRVRWLQRLPLQRPRRERQSGDDGRVPRHRASSGHRKGLIEVRKGFGLRERPGGLPQPVAGHAAERSHQRGLHGARTLGTGMATGGLRFTAANGTVYSEEALEDPYTLRPSTTRRSSRCRCWRTHSQTPTSTTPTGAVAC